MIRFQNKRTTKRFLSGFKKWKIIKSDPLRFYTQPVRDLKFLMIAPWQSLWNTGCSQSNRLHVLGLLPYWVLPRDYPWDWPLPKKKELSTCIVICMSSCKVVYFLSASSESKVCWSVSPSSPLRGFSDFAIASLRTRIISYLQKVSNMKTQVWNRQREEMSPKETEIQKEQKKM